jgi:hypothetical protein
MHLRFREAWRVLVSRSPDASETDARAEPGDEDPRRAAGRWRSVVAWLDARPVRVAYTGVTVSFMGCFVAPLAPLGWWLSVRALAALPNADDDTFARARSAATWGVRIGAVVTVLVGIGLFLYAVGALV